MLQHHKPNTNHTLPCVYIRLFQAQTPGQCSHVSRSAVRKVVMAEIWPPSGCLHYPDTGEDEERERETERELLTAAALQPKV